MGYYFEGSAAYGKGEELVAKGAREITQEEARQLIESPGNEAVFCVLRNPTCDIAGLVYNQPEFHDYSLAQNKRWYAMESTKAHALAGYKPPVGELAQTFADRFERVAAEIKEMEKRE